MYMTMHRNLPA